MAALAPVRFGLLSDEMQRGRHAEMLVLLDRKLGAEPGHPDLLYFRAEARRLRNHEGDIQLALGDLQAAIASGRAPAVAQRALGHVQRTLQQPAAAREAFERYLELLPQAPDAALVRQLADSLKAPS
jgi:beta-barrel assembly-enhancing protease